ncbi:conjugative transposon protein TraK [Prevotella sp.]|nr:conjugative transposon protein TraK [Prevotella sp.]
MVIKNLENKVKLVTIICSLFLIGCVLISISSIWTAKNMVVDAQNKIYVLDGNVPILVQRTTMDETLDVEAKSHIEMFHHYFFTLAPDDKYIKYTIKFDKEKMEFTYYGRQRIERRTNVLTRELVTAGQLKRVPRTDNNPHGLLIINWRTLLNKDIDQKTKSNY